MRLKIINKRLSIILISFLGILVYSNSFSCTFHYDDHRFIVNNIAIRDIHNLHSIWNFWHCRFITFLSLAINYHLNRLDVLGYHLFNLSVHLITAVLVWWLVLLTFSTPVFKNNKITQDASMIALFAGLIFVSHPVQVEAVTNIWQRAASMAAMFYLASICCYIKYRLTPRHRMIYFTCSLALAVVGMFTKENTVTLPLMILLYEFTFLKLKKDLEWKYITPFLLTIFIIPITFLYSKTEVFQSHHGNLRIPGGVITPIHYFLTEFRVMATYIRLAFFPINQNFDYDYPIFKNIFELPVFFSILFLAAIFYGAIRLFSKYRLVSFSIFWFFLTLTIPESSFWAMGDVILEYRLYLPLVGYCIFLAVGLYYLLGKNNIPAMIIALSLIVACNSILTYQRNKVWRNEFTLWNDVIQKSPHKARGYNNRGIMFASQGNINQAMSDYNKAIDLFPDYADPYYNQGTLNYHQERITQAFYDFNKAITISPEFSEAYYNRGFIYAQSGNYTHAIADYSKAIKINPQYVQAYYNRGICYAKSNNFTQALLDYNKAIELDPSCAAAYNNRGFIYGIQGNYSQALTDFNKAIEINPNYLDANKNRTLIYHALKNNK